MEQDLREQLSYLRSDNPIKNKKKMKHQGIAIQSNMKNQTASKYNKALSSFSVGINKAFNITKQYHDSI